MRDVTMHTSKLVCTREATYRLVKTPGSTYTKADLEDVASNTTQMNYEEKNQRIRLIKYFEDLFDGTIGDWYTEPIDLELNTYYKQFNCK